MQGHKRVGRTQAGVGHAEFYVTAAIVMPVLFAIVLFQPRAVIPANLRQGRGRVNGTLALILMLLVVLFPLYAEGTTIYALYLNEDSHGQRLVAFIGVTELLLILVAVVVGHVQGGIGSVHARDEPGRGQPARAAARGTARQRLSRPRPETPERAAAGTA